MTNPTPRRRHSWTKSQSDSFGPIKQVGVGIAIGLPLLVVGVLFIFLLLFNLVGATNLWLIAGGIAAAGLLAGLSGRII